MAYYENGPDPVRAVDGPKNKGGEIMYEPYTGSGVAARDVREYARVFHEIDGERRELAAFAAHRGEFPNGSGVELARHKDRLRDLAELEELLMIRTRYVDFGPHWRAHLRFRQFLNAADTREELLFCSDWLRQHESAADAEFRQWLRHCCVPDEPDGRRDPLFGTAPERILLTAKIQLF